MAFFPLFDRNPCLRIARPWVTYGLIGACVLVFFYQVSGSALDFQRSVYKYGAIPALLFGTANPADWMLPAWQTLITSMFLHGSWWHLIANMLFLNVFGDNVEDAMGHLRYLVFYLLCGAGATLAHAVAAPDALIPVVGASGAISGILGAYFLLHPRATVMALVGWLIIPVPAYLMLGLWIGFQVLSALASAGVGQGVAWWAHIGGFALGMALTPFFKLPTAPYGGINGIKRGIRLRRLQGDDGRGDDGGNEGGPWG